MLWYQISVPFSWVKKSKKNCLLKHIIGGKRGGTRRQRGRRKQLLDEFRGNRRYCKFKEKAQDRSLWRKSLWKRLWNCSRLRLKCDGTRAETRFRLSAKRTSPFKSAGASVQSTTGSRGVRISGSNVG